MIHIAAGVLLVILLAFCAFVLNWFLGSWGWLAIYVLLLWIGHFLCQHFEHQRYR